MKLNQVYKSLGILVVFTFTQSDAREIRGAVDKIRVMRATWEGIL